jgi:transcriptional regulator with XRE-family HTH domain
MKKHTGIIVKSRMNEMKITQKTLSKEIGTSHARLSQWMNGHEIPSDRVIRKVAEQLDLDFEKLRLQAERERYRRDYELLKQKYAEVLKTELSSEFPSEFSNDMD